MDGRKDERTTTTTISEIRLLPPRVTVSGDRTKRAHDYIDDCLEDGKQGRAARAFN
jgi:hypothetical protein